MGEFLNDETQCLLGSEEMEKSEIPKHKKKTKSSTSKSSSKSNHKHEYRECLFIEREHVYRGTYCSICGKIGDVHFFEAERSDDGLYIQLDYDKVFEKYKHLDQIEVEDIFQKFVPVSR